MKIEKLSAGNLGEMAAMAAVLFPESTTEEEKKYYGQLASKKGEDCFLAKMDGKFAGFIHLKLRHDYVEGAISSPVAYLEAVFVKPEFRKTGSEGSWLISVRNGEENRDAVNMLRIRRSVTAGVSTSTKVLDSGKREEMCVL